MSRNAIAKDLRTPKWRPRVIKLKTRYDRKKDKRENRVKENKTCTKYESYPESL